MKVRGRLKTKDTGGYIYGNTIVNENEIELETETTDPGYVPPQDVAMTDVTLKG